MTNFCDDLIERCRHQRVKFFWVIAFDEIRFIAVASKQRFQFLVADSGQDGRAGNLVAVQMQDGQNRAVMHRVKKFIRVPTGGQRASLGFAIAHHARDNQIGIVERSAVGMHQ